MRTLDVPEAAYLAGIVDGEGTIVIADRRGSRAGSTRPSVNVSVANTYRGLLEWISEVTGTGKIVPTGPAPGTVSKYGMHTRKQSYLWKTSSLNAVGVLAQLVPYMIEKRERAQLAIDCTEQGYGPLDALGGPGGCSSTTPMLSGTV